MLIDQLLRDLFTGALEVGRRKVKSAGRRKANRTVKPALDVIGEFLDALHKVDQEQRRSLHPSRTDRRNARPRPASSERPDALRAYIQKAAGFLSQHSGVPANQILSDRGARDRSYREAAKRLHLDRGGDEGAMQQLTAYWRVLKILDEVQ